MLDVRLGRFAWQLHLVERAQSWRRTDAHWPSATVWTQVSLRIAGKRREGKKPKQKRYDEDEDERAHKVRPVPDDRLVVRARSRPVYGAHAPAASHPPLFSLPTTSTLLPTTTSYYTLFYLSLSLSLSKQFDVANQFLLLFLSSFYSTQSKRKKIPRRWSYFDTLGNAPTPSGGPVVTSGLTTLSFSSPSREPTTIPIPRSYKEERGGGDSSFSFWKETKKMVAPKSPKATTDARVRQQNRIEKLNKKRWWKSREWKRMERKIFTQEHPTRWTKEIQKFFWFTTITWIRDYTFIPGKKYAEI